MALIDLSSYKPVNATLSDAGAISNAFTAIQNAVNLLDNTNVSSSASIAVSKLAAGSNGQFLGVSAGVATWQSSTVTTYRKTSSKTINTSVAETDLLNAEITIAANDLSTNKMLRLTCWGDTLNNNALTTLPIWKLKFGATTLVATAAGSANTWQASATRFPWRCVAEIMNLGATNSQLASIALKGSMAAQPNPSHTALTTGEGLYTVGIVAGGGQQFWVDGFNTSAEDTTTSKTLVFTVTLPVSNASVEAKLVGALIEVL